MWQDREETYYNHWTRGKPKNQIQLAFRNHWLLFNEIMKDKLFNGGKRCLEVGCGRGTISAYFSDSGYDCTLLDKSPKVVEAAKQIFKIHNLKGTFIVGDVYDIGSCDNSFDIVVSIGLLEHLRNVKKAIQRQISVLVKGGIFLGYVVPKYTNNIQSQYNWINEVLQGYVQNRTSLTKSKVYRSKHNSGFYMKIMSDGGLKGVKSSGVYPLPMISHSIEFPFTLMPEKSEQQIVQYFEQILERRKASNNSVPWMCKEGYGQAFLVWGFKK